MNPRDEHPAGKGRWTHKDDEALAEHIRQGYGESGLQAWEDHVASALEASRQRSGRGAGGPPRPRGHRKPRLATWTPVDESIRRATWTVVVVLSVTLVVAGLLAVHL